MSRTPSQQSARISFGDWYQERFNSDPGSLLDHFQSEVQSVADHFGIDWGKTSSSIRLSTSEQKLKSGQISYSRKGFKGKTPVWARIIEDDDYRQFPFITFQTWTGGQHSDVFNGMTAAWDLYKREANIQVTASERAKRQQELEKKQQERELRDAKLKAEAEADNANKAAVVQRDLALFDTLKPAEASHRYAKKKRISAATLSATNVRQGGDKNGAFLALQLINIHRQPVGLQKIYEEKFKPSPSSDPTDKTFTWGMQMDGAFMCIGDVWQALEQGLPVSFVEGFATGTSWYAATKTPTVVTLNSGNLVKVLTVFSEWYPSAEKIIPADNDYWKNQEGKGNAGLKAALALVKKYPGSVKAYYPNWQADPLVDLSDKPTDWNDVHLCHPNGLRGIKQMLKSKSNRLVAETKPWLFSLQELSFCNRYQIEAQIKTCVSRGMDLYPAQIGGKEILESIMANIQPGIDTGKIEKHLRDRIKWIIDKKLQSAKKLNGFTSEKLNQSHIKHHRFKPVRRGAGWYEIPDNVLHMMRNMEGLIIVKAPMGSGKTQKLMKPLIHESETAAYIAHRVSLVASACEKLSTPVDNIFVDNYLNMTAEMMPHCRFLGTCINSAVYPKFANFFDNCETICIDEAKQTLAHVTDGTIENPVPVFEFLERIMNSAKRVVMCDADANDALLEFCELACPGQTIHVIEIATNCSDYKLNFGSAEQVYQSIIDATKAGERCLVATDGAQSGADLAADIRSQVPGAKVLMIQRDSRGDAEVEAFQTNPDVESYHYDVVIYSPSISSGVSIENNYFTRHFGLFYGMVGPTDAVQMLRRDRFAKEFVVGFKRIDSRKETDRDLIILGKILANQLIAGKDNSNSRWGSFDQTWATFAASERRASNDFANNMLLMMLADGYQISRAVANPLKEELARHSKKLAREICVQENIDRVMSVETPDDELAASLKRRDLISREDAAKLVRYMIESELKTAVQPDVISFAEDRGVSKVKRLERALAPSEAAEEYDSILIRKGVVMSRRSNVSAAKAIWNTICQHTGINLETGEGEFGSEQAKEAFQAALPDISAIAVYNELNIGPYVNPKAPNVDATKWVVAVLERLGLKLKMRKAGRQKLRKHYLCSDQHGFMMRFINNRRTADVSCLKIVMTADEEYAISSQPMTEYHPHTPHGMVTGGGSQDGGAGCFNEYLSITGEPATTGNNAGLIDLNGVNHEGLAQSLVQVAIDLDIPLPDTGGNTEMLLILLTLELKERLAHQPDLISQYPEINWIDWKTQEVA